MSATEWVVLLGGIVAIAWVNWYFFLAEGGSGAAVAGGGGVQEARVEVRGGYAPATLRVRAGARVRLVFAREESSGCSEEVVIPAFRVRRFLPAWEETVVELPAMEQGTYQFTCGMGMLRGKIVAG